MLIIRCAFCEKFREARKLADVASPSLSSWLRSEHTTVLYLVLFVKHAQLK